MNASDIQVKKNWETFANRDLVVFQHLDPLDKAQESFAKLVGLNSVSATNKEVFPVQTEFIMYFLKSCLKARIKIVKLLKHEKDREFKKRLDNTISLLISAKFNTIQFEEFASILFGIGMIYENLRYSSVERMKTYTSLQSDIMIPGMEASEELGEVAVTEEPITWE